jgi:hypothetical protein
MREASSIKMTKEQLAPWIEKLNAAEPKDYDGIVAAMCGENGIKKKAAWQFLKDAGFEPKAGTPPGDKTPQSGDQQGGATPDSTGAAAQPSGNTPPTDDTKHGTVNQESGKPPALPAPEQKPAKKRVKHEKLKGKNLIAGNKTIAFDADGIAELDAVDAKRLLTIPGYTEVKE